MAGGFRRWYARGCDRIDATGAMAGEAERLPTGLGSARHGDARRTAGNAR